MLSAMMVLFLNSLYFILRVSGGGTFPRPLTAKEESEYLALAAHGDMNARNKLVEHNLRLVAHVVKKYYSSSMETDDLISIGTIGLIKAISNFKAERGAKLATYAARCVENEILMHFRSQRRQVQEMSLSEPFDNDSDGGDLSFIDIISSDDSVLDEIDSSEIYKNLNECVDIYLDDREKMIIRLRYGLNGNIPKTQREIADKLNISRSYVSRIEKHALEKLEKVIKDV